jgi:prevent-host-death family protein
MNWSIAEAKAHFSSVVEQAKLEPQLITRHGQATAIVVSIDEWQKRAPLEKSPESLIDFFLNAPRADLELPSRTGDKDHRKVEL